MPLEGDVVPLEDTEEAKKNVISSTLVGKVICSKVLNRRAVKNILHKTWGEPATMTIAYLVQIPSSLILLKMKLPRRSWRRVPRML